MLEVRGLTHEFQVRRGLFGGKKLVAVNNVSLQLAAGTTVGLVGESGSGKSTLGRCIVRLLTPTRGELRLGGVSYGHLRAQAMAPLRRRLQMVFQDPDEALNPRLSVGQALAEPLRQWQGLRGAALDERVADLLDRVQLDRSLVHRYPHELSGGQQQRVGIARALAPEPEVIVLDEPSSALDVSVRAQILNLLADLQTESKTAYLLISHDLSTVRYLARHVIVLYLGTVVEQGPVESVLGRPQHPYTRALLTSAPRLQPRHSVEPLTLSGEVGNPFEVGTGCPLAPRCPLATATCAKTPQTLVETDPGHEVACHVVTGTTGLS